LIAILGIMPKIKLRSVLFVGNYDEEYSRNAIFIKGLRRNKITVLEFNIKSYNFIKNILLCAKNFKRLNSQNFDLILLHAPNIIQFLFAKLLSKVKGKPLIHDIYISKLQTFYYDRKLYRKTKMPKFFYRVFYYLQDLSESVLSNYIILDTYSHIKFFHQKFNIPIKKFRRILVGAQDDIYFPLNIKKKNDDNFIVGYWGTFIPVHGVEYIINAAKILEKENDIKFVLIGKGQTFNENKEYAERLKIKNIEFIPKLFLASNELYKLPEFIAKCDVGLGIFGKSNKTIQVIPNKVFEGNAMKLPMISCDSPAICELFTHERDILLCDRANPESLAHEILKLKNNKELREKINKNAYNIFINFGSINALAFKLVNILEKILNEN